MSVPDGCSIRILCVQPVQNPRVLYELLAERSVVAVCGNGPIIKFGQNQCEQNCSHDDLQICATSFDQSEELRPFDLDDMFFMHFP